MTNEDLAQGLFRQTQGRYRTMKEALAHGDYPYAVLTPRNALSSP